MIDESDIKNIEKFAEEFFEKMTMPASKIGAKVSSEEEVFLDQKDLLAGKKDSVVLDVFLEEPQILIGQGGQTLFEIQRVLRALLNKKLQKIFPCRQIL